MEPYVGMYVSLEETSICVVDGSGEIVSEGGDLGAGGDCRVYQGKGRQREAHRSGDGSDDDLAVARAAGAGLAGDLP